MNLFLKKKTGVMLVAVVLCAAVAVGALVTFQSAQAETPMTAQEALDALAQSVTINDKELTFTIPESYEKADDWRIQVSGRYQMGEEGTMSVHLVDNDGTAGRWKGGEGAYSITIWTSLKASPCGPSSPTRMGRSWSGRWTCWRSAAAF